MRQVKRISQVACIVFFGAMSAPSFGAIVDYREHPITITSHNGALDVEAKFFINSDDERVTSERFAGFMATQLGSCPAASLAIVEPTATFRIDECVPGKPNWRELLGGYTNTGIVCTLSLAAGFLEVSYEKEPGKLLKASLARGIVPPLAIVADDGAQVLAVWATASGITIRYDEATMEREASRVTADHEKARKSLLESKMYSGPGEIETEILRSRPTLVMKGGESIDEMMQQLAALSGCIARQDGEGWAIAPPDATEAEAAVSRVLVQLSDEKFDHGYSSAASALVKFGEPAVPVLLSKLNASTCDDDSYLYNTVASVLARIPCAARDAAFLEELERTSAESSPPFLYHWFGVAMVQSLSDSAYQPALPLLQQLAAKTPPDEVATAARVALGNMGAAPAPAPASSLLKVDQAVADQIKNSNRTEAFNVLVAVVDSGFQPYGVPLEITKLTVDSEKTTFSGNLRDGKGNWTIDLAEDGSAYSINASYYCGNLCASGFVGRAEYKNGRWLIVEWKQTWVS